MSQEKQKLEYEVQTTLEGCVEHLERLVSGLKSGQVVLDNRSEALHLHPAKVVHFKLKARQKGTKESVELELDWNREPVVRVGGARELQIGGDDDR